MPEKPDGRSVFYTIQGRSVPRVTAVLGVISKPELMAWYGKMQREKDAAIAGTCKTGKTAAAQILAGGSAGEAMKEAAGERGASLHKAIEARLLGRAPDLDDTIRKPFETWQTWWKTRKLKALAVEKTIYYLGNEGAYAGTLDALVDYGGTSVILDWKTGRIGYPEQYLQSAAYSFAAQKMGMKNNAGYLVRIPPDGSAVEVLKRPPEVLIDDFFAILRAWRVMRKLKGLPYE